MRVSLCNLTRGGLWTQMLEFSNIVIYFLATDYW